MPRLRTDACNGYLTQRDNEGTTVVLAGAGADDTLSQCCARTDLLHGLVGHVNAPSATGPPLPPQLRRGDRRISNYVSHQAARPQILGSARSPSSPDMNQSLPSSVVQLRR